MVFLKNGLAHIAVIPSFLCRPVSLCRTRCYRAGDLKPQMRVGNEGINHSITTAPARSATPDTEDSAWCWLAHKPPWDGVWVTTESSLAWPRCRKLGWAAVQNQRGESLIGLTVMLSFCCSAALASTQEEKKENQLVSFNVVETVNHQSGAKWVDHFSFLTGNNTSNIDLLPQHPNSLCKQTVACKNQLLSRTWGGDVSLLSFLIVTFRASPMGFGSARRAPCVNCSD